MPADAARVESRAAARAAAPRRLELRVGVETLLVAAGLYWAVAANRLFFAAALAGRPGGEASSWALALSLGVLFVALHVLLLAPLAGRRTVKPLLAVLLVATAVAVHFMREFGVCFDPAMLRNALHTDWSEARELLSWRLVADVALYAGLPLLLLGRVRVVRRTWRRAAAVRGIVVLSALAAAVAALPAAYQPLAALVRNDRALRYRLVPATLVVSLGRLALARAPSAAAPRRATGTDAAPGPSWAGRTRPRLVVLVVGETARAADWGLNGAARQTTPELARLPLLVNFRDTTSCGTDTETSLPCMFAPVGRRQYDEARIRGDESLLHVVARAGVAVHWRDNQSGCKGVCDGLPGDSVAALAPPGACDADRCLDEGLLAGLDARLAGLGTTAPGGTALWVLHLIGNHGPAYFRRYPPAYARFQPACETDDLGRCSREQIVNAYDNALLYTDHLLATLIGRLQAHAGEVDTALVYVSDHGESLGEKGLFLHGVPYAIAPREQTRVPMLMWTSPAFAASSRLDAACLRRRAEAPASHDHLFHTLLGLLDVRTALYEPALDLAAGCRGAGGEPAP